MPRMLAETPQGLVLLEETDGALTRVTWLNRSERRTDDPPSDAPTPLLAKAAEQLAAYYAGDLTAFDLPLAPHGSDFQKAVWDQMLAIPYGQTRTYGNLAKVLGIPANAVGQACGANPIPIIIPCHRVVAAGSDLGQGLGGFSGGKGLKTKEELLTLEGWSPSQLSLL